MAKSFRYKPVDHWFKGNTHVHSTVSDGALDFAQLSALYAGAGYDFLVRADHWKPSDARSDPAAYPLLWLDGMELDGRDEHNALFHIVCLGTFTGIDRTRQSVIEATEAARAQGGIIILAHPHWCANTFEDTRRFPFDGVEVYNNVCQWGTGKGDGSVYWSAMLAHNPNALAFASDDTHLTAKDPGWNGGWIMVNAAERTPEALLEAIRTGQFYATTGPEFYTIERNGGSVHVRTSPVKFIWLVGPGSKALKFIAQDGDLLTEAEFTLPEWDTMYLKLEDANRRNAWSNPLFCVES
ncbi:MAG TPA: hypothetical protein VIO61_00130 [Anaerolineaceae bacterium]